MNLIFQAMPHMHVSRNANIRVLSPNSDSAISLPQSISIILLLQFQIRVLSQLTHVGYGMHANSRILSQHQYN